MKFCDKNALKLTQKVKRIFPLFIIGARSNLARIFAFRAINTSR